MGAKGFAVKFYKIARLLWKLFFAMETNPICAGFELPFALFKYHEPGSSSFYISEDWEAGERKLGEGWGRGKMLIKGNETSVLLSGCILHVL